MTKTFRKKTFRKIKKNRTTKNRKMRGGGKRKRLPQVQKIDDDMVKPTGRLGNNPDDEDEWFPSAKRPRNSIANSIAKYASTPLGQRLDNIHRSFPMDNRTGFR
jgi:hypothetical protein